MRLWKALSVAFLTSVPTVSVLGTNIRVVILIMNNALYLSSIPSNPIFSNQFHTKKTSRSNEIEVRFERTMFSRDLETGNPRSEIMRPVLTVSRQRGHCF